MASPPPIVFLDIDGVLNDAAFLDKRDAELSTLATILSDAAIQHDPHKGTLSLAERAQRAVDGWQAMSDAEDKAQMEIARLRAQLERATKALTTLDRASTAIVGTLPHEEGYSERWFQWTLATAKARDLAGGEGGM
jgi:hypothetical protein